MGLNEQRARATYLSIGEGKIAKSLKEACPGSVSYQTKSGMTKHVLEYDSIDGVLAGVDVRSSDFNGTHVEKAQWCFKLVSGGDVYIITTPYSSGYAKYILNQLCNLEDFAQPIRIKPWKFQPADSPKPKMGCTVYTGDAFNIKVEPRWAKGDEAMPEMKKVKFKGQDSWDDTEQNEFYEKMVAELITPNLSAVTNAGHAVAQEVDDEVPF